MSIWGWILIAVGVIVWSFAGAMSFLLWAFSENESTGRCRLTQNLKLMTVICGPAVWVMVAHCGIQHWLRNRGDNKRT